MAVERKTPSISFCPRCPAMAFSAKPQDTGWGFPRIARAWALLMERLGSRAVRVPGRGPWIGRIGRDGASGASGTTWHPRHYARDSASGRRQALNDGDPAPSGLSDAEKAAFAQLDAFYKKGSGYSAMMGTRPQTLGYGLADSPAGQAAWMYDKFAAWTQSGGEPQRVLTLDDMLDDISLYWFTDSATSAAQLYWENNESNRQQL